MVQLITMPDGDTVNEFRHYLLDGQ